MSSEHEQRLLRAVDLIKQDQPDPQAVHDAVVRVGAALSVHADAMQHDVAQATAIADATDELASIADYVAMVPAFVRGDLAPPRELLFRAELRQSAALRRAVAAQRGGGSPAARGARASGRGRGIVGWASAAAVALLAVGAVTLIWPRLPVGDQAQLAQVISVEHERAAATRSGATADAMLYRLVDNRLQPLEVGAWVNGDEAVRTAPGVVAVLGLDDGSRIEVDARSQLSLSRRQHGSRITVEHGRILVQAAQQEDARNLVVVTDDLTVKVTGTIFGVSSGVKGSRVSVVEGSVAVELAGRETSLGAGDHFGTFATNAGASSGAATGAPVERVATRQRMQQDDFDQELAWSQHADQYLALLRTYRELNGEIQALLTTAPRYDSQLLALAPTGTVVYVAAPNTVAQLADAYELFRERLLDNSATQAMWQRFETRGAADDSARAGAPDIAQILAWLRQVGSVLGAETVLTIAAAAGAGEVEPSLVPTVLAELSAGAGAVDVEAVIAELRAHWEQTSVEHGFPIVLVDSPAAAERGQLSIWVTGNTLIASTEPAALFSSAQALAGGAEGFAGSELHGVLRSRYDQGAQLLAAVDLEQIAGLALDPEAPGYRAAQPAFAVLEHHQRTATAQTSLELLYPQGRNSVTSILAAPGPMAGLDFFSAQTKAVAGFVLTEPATLLANWIERIGRSDELNAASADVAARLAVVRELAEGLVANLSGEVVFGMDGPLLPTPSWKIAVEIYDRDQLQAVLNDVVAQFNAHAQDQAAAEHAAAGLPEAIELVAVTVDGRTDYIVRVRGGARSVLGAADAARSDSILDVARYTFWDGYWIIAPNQVLLDRALATYASGANLVTASQFQELVPDDQFLNFSALIFHRLGDTLAQLPLGSFTAMGLSQEQSVALRELLQSSGAAMFGAYAESDRVRAVLHGGADSSLVMLMQLVALQGSSRAHAASAAEAASASGVPESDAAAPMLIH